MKRFISYSLGAFALILMNSCSGKEPGVNNDSEIHKGRIETHTSNTHVIHQEIAPNEAEMVKEHISYETSVGSSSKSIDEEGARIINEHRKNQKTK